MFALVKTAARAARPVPSLLAAPMATSFNVFQYALFLVLLFGGTPATDPHLVEHLGMFAALALVAFASCGARALGWATHGSAAGLPLAIYALTARACYQCLLRVSGVEGFTSVYDAFPRLTTLVWAGRNLTLVAYGYGLGLVVFSSIADVVRRRRAPAWALDDA